LLCFLITTDALQFTYGVLAFRKWIKEKNSELALSTKSAKPFKTDILQLSTEELNYTLCMFVKEVRKPDGDEYAPDIIFYLCLGKFLKFTATRI
jgi:zinc finger MYM-type protein 2/3/4